jgi:hypothetical protein
VVNHLHVWESVVAPPPRHRDADCHAVGRGSPGTCLALELATVPVNAVTPSLMDTPLLHSGYGPERDTIVQNRAAIFSGKRVGTAEEVVQLILMLITSDNMMGEVVHVDEGGRFVKHRSNNPTSNEPLWQRDFFVVSYLVINVLN